jgi:hypothetical protein
MNQLLLLRLFFLCYMIIFAKCKNLLINIFIYLYIFIFSAEYTSINATVLPSQNEHTRSLQNANLILIIKQDVNHGDVHHLRLNVNQSLFPIHFIIKNITEIKNNGVYLLSLLILGQSHRFLWEGLLFRQHLSVNHVNDITFIVQDVCE